MPPSPPSPASALSFGLLLLSTMTYRLQLLLTVLLVADATVRYCNAFSIRPTAAIASSTRNNNDNDRRRRIWRVKSTDEIIESTSSVTDPRRRLFDESTLAEADDALSSVGWSSLGEDPLTSDDPFVVRLNESIIAEMGVGLDGLLNPAKVVNLERDLYNLRSELATLTGIVLTADDAISLTTVLCDGGGGGDIANEVRTKIAKKEKDLIIERRSVFRSWLKTVFLGQAGISTALSYIMATNPSVLFGSFDWYNNVSNMDTSITVLGFWWWWLFIVPSLRSRRPSGWEKSALDVAFLGTPLVSLASPILTKDTGLIWWANFVVVAGAYGFAYFTQSGGNNDEENGEEDENLPSWLKFVYKSLDFGAGRERGARK